MAWDFEGGGIIMSYIIGVVSMFATIIFLIFFLISLIIDYNIKRKR